MTMRERILRGMATRNWDRVHSPIENGKPQFIEEAWRSFSDELDAVILDFVEINKECLDAGQADLQSYDIQTCRTHYPHPSPGVARFMAESSYSCMLQHIRDELQQEDTAAAKQIPHKGVVNAGEKPS